MHQTLTQKILLKLLVQVSWNFLSVCHGYKTGGRRVTSVSRQTVSGAADKLGSIESVDSARLKD